ncbi:ATP-binding protein [Candidatus Micrarchaeota archaeon]|nr:ATP-binding protein [Candidatus Micrarchaeota archaeon]
MEKEVIITKVLEKHTVYLRKLKNISKKRYLYRKLHKIVKENEYFLGITGLRGIGKTILLLQLAEEFNGVYLSADDRELRGIDLYDIIKALAESGYNKIFIDEIHTKPDWDKDLKSVYDERLAYIVFTGSSSIKIKKLKVDLSRRLVIEHLMPASFREWMMIKKDVELPLLSLNKMIKNKTNLTKRYGYAHKYINDYYKYGGVLYDARTDFYKTILSTIEMIAVKDLSIIKEIDPEIEENFFKLLYMIALSKPLELSYSKLGNVLDKNKVWVMRFLADVEKTEVLKRVYPCGKGVKMVRKEAKYYLPFPYRYSLCDSLNKSPDIGSLREEFFINHINSCYLKTNSKSTADFNVKNMIFEIGGSGKRGKQNADYIVFEGLDTSKNKIPLFLFGLLY